MTKLERLILTSKPISFIREKSKKIILPGFKGLPLYDVFIFFMRQVKREGLNVRAAAISYNIFMAIPAATLFLFTLLPYLPVSKNIHTELLHLIDDISPNQDAKENIKTFLDDFFNHPKSGLLSVGFLLALFYSSNAMMGIIRTFDRSLLMRAKTNFLTKRIRAIKLTLILLLLIVATALISIGQNLMSNTILEWMNITNESVKSLILSLRVVVVIFIFLFSIALIYKFAPSVHKRWQLFSPGATLATILMMLSTWIFSYWAQNFSTYNKFYGSLGTLLLIMLLIFINSLVLLIGYELNVSISQLNENSKVKLAIKEDRQALLD